MTIITTQSRITYAGDNVTTGFPVPFEFFLNTDLMVVKNAIGGAVVTQILNIDYTLSGANTPGGGSLNKTTPLLTGETLAIFLNPPIAQASHYLSNSPFPASTLENDIDRQTQISQRLSDQISRALRAPDGDPTTATNGFLLPSAASRALTNLGFDVNGNPSLNIQLASGTMSAASIGGFIGPQTASEAAAGLTIVAPWLPTGNVLRYGFVPNSAPAAAANTALAKALWNPAFPNGPQGQFYFPNTTGADIYYFNGVIPMRYGCYIDLGGCTLNYTATVGAGDANTGLFLALSDFSLRNGSIAVACDTTATTGAGHAIFIGGRDVGTYFTVFDSLLPRTLGRIVLQNLTINVNNTGTHVSSSGAIEMLGGIRNLLAENININLNGSCPYGIIYEFGWATNEAATKDRQTSHAHDMIFRNIDVVGVGNQDGGAGAGISLGGAYNCLVDGLYVNGAPTAFNFYPGEALFYRPWVGVDDIGAKHNITLRNIVGDSLTGTGISLGGASSATSSYLAATIAALGHPADYIAQTDLMTFSLDGFVIQAAGVGINVSGPCDIRNGTLNGAAASGQLVVDDECTFGTFTNLKMLNGAGQGVRMGFPNYSGATSDIWNPPRLKTLIFDNCIVAGNTGIGYSVVQTRSVIIRGGRIGYSSLYDSANEATQTNCIVVAGGSGGAGVTAERVYCTPVTGGGGLSYATTGTTSGNNVRDPLGTISFSGIWNLNGVVQATSTNFGTAASVVNTTFDKYAGKVGNDTSNHRLMIALGPNPTDQWIPMTPTTAITPA